MTTTLLVDTERFALPELQVTGDDYRHLFRAKRLRCGDEVCLVDGGGQARRAEVASVDSRCATLVCGAVQEPRMASVDIDVWVATLRPERASWLVEKVTELGVRRIVFYRAQRSQKDYGEKQRRRLERVSRAALQQSGGARLPVVEVGRGFDELFESTRERARESANDQPQASTRTIVLDTLVPEPGADLPPADLSASPPLGSSHGTATPRGRQEVRLLVGPEGGFTGEERRALRAAASALPCDRVSACWEILTLGDLVLRVETAAVVGTALVMHRTTRRS